MLRPIGVTVLLLLLSLPARADSDRPPILAGAEIDYPPFSLVDAKGRADGFAVELLRAALEAMGKDLRFETGPWAQLKDMLAEGRLQALPLVGRTPEREALFDFTFPYMSLHGAIVLREGTRGIEELSDLEGRDVATMQGDNAEEFLRREPRNFRIHTTRSVEEALRRLSEGEFEAVVAQRLVALRLIRESGLQNLQVVNRPIEGFRQDFCFAVREGDRETLALLNEGLALVMADGTFRHLHAKWFADMELPSHRRLIVGGDANFPPFEFLDEQGQPRGFNVDLTRALARELGLEVEIRLGPWPDVLARLARGEIDLIQGMYNSVDRDRRYDFTQPFEHNRYVAVVRAEEGPAPVAPAELRGKRLVVERGDIAQEWLAGQGLGEALGLAENQEQALRQVLAGQADVALVSRLASRYLIDKKNLKGVVLGQRALFSGDYCMAVAQSRKALRAMLSEGLKILHESGERRRIAAKWLSPYRPESFDMIFLLKRVAVVLVPLALLALALFLWTWSLRRQVARRTAELAESQGKLLQAQKLESVGRLAGGVAHDFNNMLGVMVGYTQLAMDELEPDHPLQGDLAEILSAARRSADLTRQLLAFARKQSISPKPLDLNQRVSGTLKMLGRLIGEDVKLEFIAGEDLWPVLLDPAQVDQILANLCVNARDAIDNTGQITIETGNVHFDAADCQSHSEQHSGDFVMLAVSDDGRGMDAETRKQVFDPFFTTKGLGQGTGLGLATVYGIVQQNEGFIHLYSEPGQGTTLRIYFRRMEQAMETAPREAEGRLPAGEGERILVVEDEEAILRLSLRILNGLGYQAQGVRQPKAALELAEQMKGELDLLLTDVIMPQMNGKELAERLRAEHPRLKVLFMSGYTANVIAKHGVLEDGVHFLEKPFNQQQLAEKLRQVLDMNTET